MKNGVRRFVRPAIILIGLVVLLYPSVSEFLSERNASRAVTSYDETMFLADQESLRSALEAARAYNRLLYDITDDEIPGYDKDGNPISLEDYWDLLDLGGNSIMGYISIPKINETIPIYHGTEGAVMQVGIGHLQCTSLPVGGPSTHAGLSGHTGLPSASLFTNLDQLEVGDPFFLRILDQTLCYTVDRIDVVLPDDAKHMAIVEGEDYVTLITCTPYGVNSHRLLVRGARTPYTPPKNGKLPVAKTHDITSFRMKLPMQYRHLMMGAGALLLVLLLRRIIIVIIRSKKKRREP